MSVGGCGTRQTVLLSFFFFAAVIVFQLFVCLFVLPFWGVKDLQKKKKTEKQNSPIDNNNKVERANSVL
jgi:cytochrome oxidase assembly protein ShyY1